MDFFQLYFSVLNTTENMATAGRADINGKIIITHITSKKENYSLYFL